MSKKKRHLAGKAIVNVVPYDLNNAKTGKRGGDEHVVSENAYHKALRTGTT